MDGLKYDCCCYSLLALNIIDFEGRCRSYLSTRAPHMEWALLSLKELKHKCKMKTDRNGVEFEVTHHVNCFLKTLPACLTLDVDTVSSLTKMKYLYFKRKLSMVLKGNFFNDYLTMMKKRLKDSVTPSEGEIVLRKFLTVCKTLNLPVELSGEDVEQFEFMAELLNYCFTVGVNDSNLVVSLLKMTIDRCGIAPFDSLYVRQPLYAQGFLQYLIKHAKKERLDLESYCLYHPRTLWEYSRNFSVLNALSYGNSERLLALLQHGFHAFSELELRRSGHGFPLIQEILPPRYLKVLRMMCNMRSVNQFLINLPSSASSRQYVVTEDQKLCFQIVWRTIPDPFVKYAEMVSAIFAEYFVLAKHSILNPMRYERNMKFSMMYERCFTDMASGPKEPRSLQHLCRCTIRSKLQEQWKLPEGIFQLPLPTLMHRYLNLEID